MLRSPVQRVPGLRFVAIAVKERPLLQINARKTRERRSKASKRMEWTDLNPEVYRQRNELELYVQQQVSDSGVDQSPFFCLFRIFFVIGTRCACFDDWMANMIILRWWRIFLIKARHCIGGQKRKQ